MGVKRDWTEAKAKCLREGECRYCGVRQGLDPAHVVPRSLGGGMGELDVVPLCRRCHRDFDQHMIDLLSAISFLEQAEAVKTIGIEAAYRRLAPSQFRRVVA